MHGHEGGDSEPQQARAGIPCMRHSLRHWLALPERKREVPEVNELVPGMPDAKHPVCELEFSFMRGWYCGAPASVLAEAGCLHEHVKRRWLCQLCLLGLRQQKFICSDCHDCDLPHRCLVREIRTAERGNGKEKEEDDRAGIE